MSTLLILIREPIEADSAADTLSRAICPYLETFGGTAKLASVQRYREVRGGREQQRVTALDIALSGTARAELVTIAGWLEGFLKPTAKQAKLAARFDILFPEEANGADTSRG
jgi:hypothetical protein